MDVLILKMGPEGRFERTLTTYRSAFTWRHAVGGLTLRQ
jgi:hypothetical protein